MLKKLKQRSKEGKFKNIFVIWETKRKKLYSKSNLQLPLSRTEAKGFLLISCIKNIYCSNSSIERQKFTALSKIKMMLVTISSDNCL